MTLTPTTTATLVFGGRASAREEAIAMCVDPNIRTVIILEGLPDGKDDSALLATDNLQIIRIAVGCMCCAGNLVMRVTLNRVLRDKPAHLYISVENQEHIEQLRFCLTHEPYDALLSFNQDINCDRATPYNNISNALS
tara:strand:+ start:186548 stop:186961 length:414 start_codon:yes stop_codon:yes gene_type:complete